MKRLAVIACLVIHCAANAQTIQITSFQHVIRWVDEDRFPPYVTNEQVANDILDAAVTSISHHFISTTVTKPVRLEYRNIAGFGKPSLKDPSSIAGADLQVSVLSFISRATTGMEVYWSMSAAVSKEGKTVYSHEIKHELKNYKTEASWFTAEEFNYLFAALIDELFENRTAMDKIIAIGTKPIDQDSVLKANGDEWTGKQNKGLFTYSLPEFGGYSTVEVAKIDSPVINKKSIAARNTGVEISGGKVSFEQTKTVDQQKTNWYRLTLAKGADTMQAQFVVSTFTRKEKKTLPGFIFSKEDTDDNRDYFYNRNMEGTIRSNTDSLQWSFSLNNYVNHRVGNGSFANERESFSIVTRNAAAFSTEIVLMNAEQAPVASVFFNMNEIDIHLLKTLSQSYRQAIAALFAVIVSTKNQ